MEFLRHFKQVRDNIHPDKRRINGTETWRIQGLHQRRNVEALDKIASSAFQEGKIPVGEQVPEKCSICTSTFDSIESHIYATPKGTMPRLRGLNRSDNAAAAL